MKPVIVADYQCDNAENPLWHPLEKRLYWTDIPRGRLFRYDPVNRSHEQIYSGEPVGGFTIQADGALLLFKARGAIERWSEGKTTTIIPGLPDERETRFNDVIADPVGRVFCGTMPTPQRQGRLYRLNTDGSIDLILEDMGIPNGMGFTPNRQQFYLTSSSARKIYRFDYDAETGNLSNQTIYLSTPEGEGVPDGMTVDSEGYIWSARWDGEHLFRYDPDGTEVDRIPFPAKKVTSAAFGGSDYTQIYVSTAGGDNRDLEGEGAGAVFCLDSSVRGKPAFFSQVAWSQ